MFSGSRATSGCAARSADSYARLGKNNSAPGKPRECSRNFPTAPVRVGLVVAKAEYLEKGENPRFVVTSLGAPAWPAQRLYEQLYCARGEMENRLKEQLSLFSDRLSTETMRANQLRLYFSSLAYVLVQALRRLALQGTEWATAQVETIRLRLLKIAAEVRVTARRIWVRYSHAYPWKHLFATAHAALTG